MRQKSGVQVDFFQNLNFSSANEDGDSELKALAGARRIVCLTGSGTRPLDMLLSDAEEVVALDINPAQNALLALKMAAIARFDYQTYLSFMGISEAPSRDTLYQQIRMDLSPDVRAYWDANKRILKRGVWYAGKWEKLLKWNSRFLKLLRGRAIDRLLAAPDIESQGAIWDRDFADSKLRRAIEMIGRDWVWRWVMREPAGEFLPEPADVAARLEADFTRAAHTFFFRESDFAMLIFRGIHEPDGALPVHLRPENYLTIRERLPRLKIVQGGLIELADTGVGPADGFSLSDFGSYCGPEIYAQCWKGILSVAEPGARYCERVFMNDMPLPFAAIKPDMELSQSLTAVDRAFIYRVRAGCIEQPADG